MIFIPAIGATNKPVFTLADKPAWCTYAPPRGLTVCQNVAPMDPIYTRWQLEPPVDTVKGLSLRYDFGNGVIEDYEWPADDIIFIQHDYSSESSFNAVLTVYDGANQTGNIVDTINFPVIYIRWLYLDGTNVPARDHRYIDKISVQINYTSNGIARSTSQVLGVSQTHCWFGPSIATSWFGMDEIPGVGEFVISTIRVVNVGRQGNEVSFSLGNLADGTLSSYSVYDNVLGSPVDLILPESVPPNADGRLWDVLKDGYFNNTLGFRLDDGFNRLESVEDVSIIMA